MTANTSHNQDSGCPADSIIGTWAPEWSMGDGEMTPPEDLLEVTLMFAAGRCEVRRGNKLIRRGIFTTGPETSPGTLDVCFSDSDVPQLIDAPLRGLFEVNGDRLRICYGAPGKERARSFSGDKGTRQYLAEYRRTQSPGFRNMNMDRGATSDENESRQRIVVDQFTRQTDPFKEFAEMPGEPREMVLAATEIDATDTVLDVACGPGVTTCDLASVAGHATGIDVTPAMIERAKELQATKGLTNVRWHVGAVPPLPFDNESFSVVFTRYSFHHFRDPLAVLKEMVRVGKPGGRVVVVDLFMTTAEQARAYDQMEKLRDPSHVRTLLLGELKEAFVLAGLDVIKTMFYKQPMSLEPLLKGSFPNPGDGDKVRQIITDDVGRNQLGLGIEQSDGDIHFAYSIVVLVGQKVVLEVSV